MSKTISCVLLKVLILARADIMQRYSDSDSIQDILVSENNNSLETSHLGNVNERNKIGGILFGNMSVISEYNKSILSKPTSPRAFVEFHNRFPNKEDNISVTFRWNHPEFAEELIQGYTVQCWFIENLKNIQVCDDKSSSATILEHVVNNLKPNTTYYFQVRALTKVGISSYTDLINVSTTIEDPIPKFLTASIDGIDIWDLDLKSNISLVEQTDVTSIAYSIAEHKIYWSNNNKNLMMLDINKNNIKKIDNFRYVITNLCIDWVARNLYWMETYNFPFDDSHLIKFDLTMWESGITIYNRILKIEKSFRAGINVLPSMGILYWINDIMYNKLQIIQSDLDGKNAQKIQKNLSTACSFSIDIIYVRDTKIDNMNTKEPLIYWLLSSHGTLSILIVTNINVSMCNLILRSTEISKDTSFKSLTIDKTNIYIFGSYFEEHFMKYDYTFVLKKKYALLESRDVFKDIQKLSIPIQIYKLYAFGESSQPYPSMSCLIPDNNVYKMQIVVRTNSIIINLPEPVPKNGCKRYNLPSTLYTIYISYCMDNKLNKFNNFTVKTYERYYEIQNLTPLTEYTLQLNLSNFYFDQLSIDPLFGSKVILKTESGKLDAPENVTIQALTPTTAVVFWMSPKKLNCVPVIYKVYMTLIILLNNTRRIHESLIINKIEHEVDNKFFTFLESLKPGQIYEIYVRVYPTNFSNHYNDSSSKILYMYSEPNNITLDDVSISSMNISWTPSVNLTIRYELEYKNVEMQRWQIANNFEMNNEGKIMYYINNLLPGTLYEFRLILKYPKYTISQISQEKDFIWPSDGRFTFSTLTSDTSSISGKSIITQYYQYIISGFVTVVVIICVCYFYYLYQERNKNNQQFLPPIMTNIELAILHEMLPNGNVQFNMLYSPTLEDNFNKYVLTKINREQIILEKLLGSGAFGMVYEGKVKNLERQGTEIPVAIKKLRKNASLQEKNKFLEEATVMNQFRHKHVLRLLAVCLDLESPLMVLELMETDLLKYLRDNRKLEPSDSHALRLQDLFAMCEDVARGCCYLENLRFVHRDLACRNCLVSARNREDRVIKIGDFGLARDVYKDDYYRKKGQDLLPIRWMAPESLMFEIFTSQSDVWSFGVIMWEITSLGEHPYTGRTNLDVIDYIRGGGKLPIPLNCPPALYELMRRCWNSANNRPNFKLCLKNIIALRNNVEDILLSPVNII